jgi:DNA polymerase V
MDKFVPHSIDSEDLYDNHSSGDVKVGFSSPSADMREKLDIVKLLVKHKASTFFFRVGGVSIADSGMSEGDIVIVDRAVDPYDGCKAVCYIDGEYAVKRVEIAGKKVYLFSLENSDAVHQPIEVTADNGIFIWGVVTYVIKKM